MNICPSKNTLGHRINEMKMYFISTIKPYTSNCLKVECCALQRLHDTAQHVSPEATGETLVIVVLKQHAQNKNLSLSTYFDLYTW